MESKSANHKSYENGRAHKMDKTFKKEGTKINNNLVKPRQKFAPYTPAERKKRRLEVYKLHFEHGMPATRISELMNVHRNTITNDLKFLYRQGLNDYSIDDMSLDDVVEKQLVRLETQRDRLGLYLSDATDVTNKITIERLIADIDFRILAAIEKINHNTGQFWDQIIRAANKIAESHNLSIRYTSLFELQKISIESRKNLDEIREVALKDKGAKSI